MRTTTIRPGLLVHLSARVSGNVQYSRADIEAEHTTDEGTRKARWETEKIVQDPAEHDAATKISSKARGLIAATCAASGRFGLLCPMVNESALDAAIAEAQQLTAEFNASATLTRVDVFVMVGRIAEDDVRATQQINREVADLLAQMESGVRRLDVEAIRDAAKAAKAIASMITPEASERLQKAIDSARNAARMIVKAGETAAVEIDYRAIRAITESRTAFLDLDDNGQEIAAPTVTGRALDFDPSPITTAPVYVRPQLDLI